MILSYNELMALGPALLEPFDPELVNPASIDIRVGDSFIPECGATPQSFGGDTLMVSPKARFLVSTLEKLIVPSEYAVELRLKSSRAREGWDHALAFWFDPGWSGIGTMELVNLNQYTSLGLHTGMKIAQIIVHQLSSPVARGYEGRYQGASTVEAPK